MSRTALVIGCGGTIGCAWAIAALDALSTELGVDDLAGFDVLQGTSAGAEMVTMLTGGARVADLVRMQRDETTDPRLTEHLAATPSGVPPFPAPRLLNPRLLRTQRGLAALTGIAPTGRGDAEPLQRLADAFHPDGRLDPRARMVAFDVDRGERVVFGGPGAPEVDAGAAVRASWAIPGWMPPVVAGGRRYVDGGAASTASVDLVDDADTVYVIAPMASFPGERAPGIGGLLEDRLLRRPMSAGLHAEIETTRARGATVIPILPDATDLAGLGANFMRRSHRRAAFESAMRTAPAALRRGLAHAERTR